VIQKLVHILRMDQHNHAEGKVRVWDGQFHDR
jgi:hypothetical protein